MQVRQDTQLASLFYGRAVLCQSSRAVPGLTKRAEIVGLGVCTVLGIDPVMLVFGSEFTASAVFRTE